MYGENDYNNGYNNFNYNNNYNQSNKSKKSSGSPISGILSLILIGTIIFIGLIGFNVIDNPLTFMNNDSDVTISPKSVSLKIGASYQLNASTTKGLVQYKSSDTNIVDVNEITGYITARKSGTATITAYLKDDNSVKDDCTVTVDTTTSTVEVQSISLNQTSLKLSIGGNSVLTYRVTPADANIKKIYWSTNNKNIATVDKYGVVRGVSAGTATITIRTENGNTASCKVVVSKNSSVSTTPTVSTNTYTLTYNPNGGKVTPTSKIISKGGTYGGFPTPTRSGYTFLGWYTSQSGGSKVNSSTKITGNTTIYAHWSKNSTGTPTEPAVKVYTLTYNANGGSVSPSSKKINNGSVYGDLPTPTRSGYTFQGWYTSQSGGSKVSSSTKITGNTTIYAQWKQNSSTPTTPTTTSTPGKIHFMNTGSSDAIIIESNGHYGLIDSSNPYKDGTAWAETNVTISVQHVINYLNSLGVKYLDFVVGTHSHSDHIGGISAIADKFVNSKTKYYYRTYGGTSEDSTTNWDNSGYYNRAVNAMKNHGASLQEVTGKTPTITLGDFTIKLMNTETARSNEKSGGVVTGENKNCIVQYVTYKGKHKTLLAADMEREDEMDIANAIGHVDILKAGHHSYESATSFGFASKLSPKVVVVTNSSVAETFYPVGYYMSSNYGTKVYPTGSASNAVTIEYNDSSYKVKTGSTQAFTVTETTGNWKKINGKSWMVYKNGSPVYSDWYQDTDGAWYYMNSVGACQTGWAKLSWEGKTNWYYFKDNCAMVSNTCMTISGEKFCFSSSGACTSGRGC